MGLIETIKEKSSGRTDEPGSDASVEANLQLRAPEKMKHMLSPLAMLLSAGRDGCRDTGGQENWECTVLQRHFSVHVLLFFRI